MKKIPYLMLRSAIGFSMLGHGLARIPKIAVFSRSMTDSFKASLLDTHMVLVFSYILPFGEFAIGVCLLFGWLLRPALVSGAAIMMLLILGSCMIEHWDAIPSQLIHIAFFAVLLEFRPFLENQQPDLLSNSMQAGKISKI